MRSSRKVAGYYHDTLKASPEAIRAENGKSGAPPTGWIDDSLPFLTGLLDLIRPRVVVSLGTAAYRATRMALYGRKRDDQIPIAAALSHVHRLGPIQRQGKPAWFPFYHCGPLGLVNRSRGLQVQDWRRLGELSGTASG